MFFDPTRAMLFFAAMCEAWVLAYCGTNIQQWAFTQINWWDGEQGGKGKVYPIILLSYLLSHYPIILSVSGVRLDKPTLCGVHWENLSYYPICFGESDRISFPFKMGGGVSKWKVNPIILSPFEGGPIG